MKILVAILLSAMVNLSATADFVAHRHPCASYKDPPPGGWKRWSQKSTWPNGIIPGVNGNKVTAVIPCNKGIILDVSVTLDQLVIDGSLKVVDKGPFFVNANFVIVKGKLNIGSIEKPYNGKITFTLTNGGYKYKVGTSDLGIKGFIVVGGSVLMNGMYYRQKSWTMLSRTAKKGSSTIIVSGDVTGWPIGSTLAIASTDYSFRQAEERKITYLKKSGASTIVGLEYALFYTHWGDPIYTGVKGVIMNQAAEVALLTRRIVIRGSPEKDALIGGHFVVFQTPYPQKIIGVEFTNMGQQGVGGRYPLHFHMCRNIQGTLVRKISVHHTNQRCVVVHGSFNIRLERNIAYKTKGHCFFLEDGVESGNVFFRNLGFSTEKSVRLLKPSDSTAIQSDDVPATFWISNPNNSFVGNVGAGSEDSGFWFQLMPTVLGPAAKLPEARGVFPKFVPLGSFVDNVGHSNMRAGFRTFADGMKPRTRGGKYSATGPQNAKTVRVVFKNFRGYKNSAMGVFFRKTDSVILDGGILADNRIGGVEVHDAQNVTIRNVIILGETKNVGNPSGCNQPGNTFGNCEPLYGCSLPVDPSKARSLGGGQSPRDAPMYGIMIDQMEFPSEGLTEYTYSQGAPYPIQMYNVIFGKFSNRCKVSAAIGGDGFRNWQIYSGGHRSHKLRFLDNSPRVYFSPQYRGLQGNYAFRDSGPTSRFKIFWDRDGSLMGGKGGYYVANNQVILPSNPKACYVVPRGNAYACPGSCYRTVGFYASNYLSPSYTITRVANRASFSFGGYINTFPNLPAGELFEVQPSPAPQWLQVGYADPDGCLGAVKIDLVLPNGYYWRVGYISKGLCLGNPNGAECKITTTPICGSGGNRSKLRLVIGGKTRSKVALNLVAGKYPSC